MTDPVVLLAVLAVYVAGLFALALWVERAGRRQKALMANPVVYALSLAVYCTSWSYYGSVGKATQSGMLFLTISLGPTLAIALWWSFLRRLVRLKNALRLTSIADLLSARFGKSRSIAALATLAAWIGIVPYLALQLKAVTATFGVIAAPPGPGQAAVDENLLGAGVALAMALFCVIFGARRLDPTERHPGLMAVVAAQSLIKLAALLALGCFVAFVVNDGPLACLERAAASPAFSPGALGNGETTSYVLWSTWLVLAMSAIVFLPRQFHVAVIENADERHIRVAMWLFPLYLFLVNLFVPVLAMEGLAEGLPPDRADSFVLLLPLAHDRPLLALFVFLGGFSAAMGMVLVESTALATMAANHLILPLVSRFGFLSFVRRRILACRWAAVLAAIGLAFAFERTIGPSQMLVNIGMLSFAAALQFAPPVIGGLFWRGAGTVGAGLGLFAGLAVWIYSLALPTVIHGGLGPPELLSLGPFGLSFLRPEALFGLTVLDPLSHAVFWSLVGNIGFFVAGSLLFPRSPAERRLAEDFARLGSPRRSRRLPELSTTFSLPDKNRRFLDLLGQFLPTEKATAMLWRCLDATGLRGREQVNLAELAELYRAVETTLSGVMGAAEAHRSLDRGAIFTRDEERGLTELSARVLSELELSPDELLERIDLHQEREALIARHSAELEHRVAERTRDLAEQAEELRRANTRLRELDRLKSAFLSSVSHELRTPLTSILGFAKIVSRDLRRLFPLLVAHHPEFDEKTARVQSDLDIIARETERLTRLINDVLDLARIEEGRMVWRDQPVSLPRLVETSIAALRGMLARKKGLTLIRRLDPAMPPLVVDPDRFGQVLINLLHNAIKFTETGDIRVESRWLADGTGILRVADTGQGILPEDRERIFDKFHQVIHGDTLMNKPRGAGLGLSICRRIVERYGGAITVKPRQGRGSVFEITLPASLFAPAP